MKRVEFRTAERKDLPSIVRLLAEDELGNRRERYEDPLPGSYFEAFELIENDPNHELIVAELNGVAVARASAISWAGTQFSA